MTGTNSGAAIAQCGACTVHMMASRRVPASPASKVSANRDHDNRGDRQHAAGAKIQKAWLDHEVDPVRLLPVGQIMSASALLASNPHPSNADIDDAMSGNICRCGTYVRIREGRSTSPRRRMKNEADHDP